MAEQQVSVEGLQFFQLATDICEQQNTSEHNILFYRTTVTSFTKALNNETDVTLKFIAQTKDFPRIVVLRSNSFHI